MQRATLSYAGSSSRRWLLAAAFILWLTFVISSYFVVNKPLPAGMAAGMAAGAGVAARFSSQTPAALARTLLDLGVAAWICVAALGVGLFIWRRLFGETEEAASTLVFSMGLGLGALGLLTLALGLAGLISRSALLVMLALATLFTAPNALRLVRELRLQRPPRFIGLYLFLSLGMVVTLALLPPASWDGLSYHLKGPQLYLEAGQIRPGPDIPPLHYPSLLEMLFLLAMGLRGDVAAKLIHVVYLFLLGGSAMFIGAQFLGLKSRWLPLVFLCGTPLALVTAAWAYNDVALSFYGLAALASFLCWQSSANDRWLLLVGAFAGLMMGLKYTAAIPALFFAGMVLWRAPGAPRRRVRPLLAFLLPAGALVAPWLLKNWAFTGNPVYPFLFHGRFWDAFRAEKFGSLGTGIGFDIVELLRLPYVTTLGYADATQEATIGPFYLIFLPLILFYSVTSLRKQAPPAVKVILAYALVSYLFWTAGVVNSAHLLQGRFLLPGLVALCPVLAWLLQELGHYDHPAFSIQRFTRLALAFVFALLLVSQASQWRQAAPLAYLLGSETRDDYLHRRLGAYHEMISALNTELDSSDRVLFLWEPRSYPCAAACQPDILLDNFEHLLYQHGGAAAIAAHWREEQVSHLLIFETGLNFLAEQSEAPLPAETLAHLQVLRSQHLEPVEQWHGAYALYRIVE